MNKITLLLILTLSVMFVMLTSKLDLAFSQIERNADNVIQLNRILGKIQHKIGK